MECDKQQYPYRIVVNKHYRNASAITENNFVQDGDNIPYVYDDIRETRDYTAEGEIVVCNEKEKEGIYILSVDLTKVDPETGEPNPGAYTVVRVTGAETVRIPGIAHFEAGEFEIEPEDTIQTAVGKLDSHIKEVDERINDKVDVLHAVLDEKINEVDDRTNKRVENLEDHVDVVQAIIDSRLDVVEGIQVERLSDEEIEDHNDILSAYRLIDRNGVQLGETITIPNSLYDVYLVDENGNRVDDQYANADNVTGLTLVYNTADGSQHSITIPLGSFLQEAEFKNGLEVVNGQVNVKINKDPNDTNKDGFLEVDAKGVRIQGLRQYIVDITNSSYTAATAYTNSAVTSARTDLSGYTDDKCGEIYASATSYTDTEVLSARTDLSAYTQSVETNLTNFEEGIDEVVAEKAEDVFEYRFGGGQKDENDNPVYAIRIGYDSNSKTIRLIYRDKNGVEKPMQLGVSVDEFLAYVSGLQSARVIVAEEGGDYGDVPYQPGDHLLELIYTTTATGQEDREVKIYTKLTGYDALEVLSETEYQYRLENDDIDPDIFYYTYED